MKGLKDNHHILDAIARELLQNSRITGLVRYASFRKVNFKLKKIKICIEISTVSLLSGSGREDERTVSSHV